MILNPRIHENGSPCCTAEDALCDTCKAHFGRAASRADDGIPNPYAEPIAKMRAASATPLSTFEDDMKARRTREFAAEHAEIAAHIAAHPAPRLTSAEASEFEPPNGYQIALEKMKEAR